MTPRSIIISSTLAFLLWYNGLIGTDLVVMVAPDRGDYIYDHPDMAVPSEVRNAIDILNQRKGFQATIHEKDSLTGDGKVPEQYVVPIEEAEKVGLPAFVVTGNGKAIRVVKSPTTVDEILEAAK